MSLFKKSTAYKPFQYPWAFDAYQTMQKLHWLPEEVPLQEDVHDWNNKLSEAEKNLLTQLFRFFTKGDEDIMHGYTDSYQPVFKPTEIRMMLSAFATAECNHIHAYSQLIDTIGLPEVEYEAFADFAEMRAKHEYMFADHSLKSDGSKFTKLERAALDLAVFSAFGEGMQLFSSFAVLLSFKRRGLMKGMSTIVEWSLRDESHHVESMVKLFHTLIKEHPKLWTDELKEAIRVIAKQMVKLEDKFIDLMFAMGAIEGITPEETKTYIRYTTDRRMIQLGLKPIYRQKDNPFEWLDEMMTAHTHTNFFEGRATEYSKGGVVWDQNSWAFADGRQASQPAQELTTGLVIYSKDGCPFCSVLKRELRERGYAFVEVDLSDDSLRQEFYANTGVKSVPQVFTYEGLPDLTNPSGLHIGDWSTVSGDWARLENLR